MASHTPHPNKITIFVPPKPPKRDSWWTKPMTRDEFDREVREQLPAMQLSPLGRLPQ